MNRNQCIETFMQHMPNEIDAAIVSDAANRKYLTGFISTAGTLLITRQAAYFIVDGRYVEAAQKNISNCKVILETSLENQLRTLIAYHQIQRIGIEISKLSYARAVWLKENLAPTEVLLSSEMEYCLQQCRAVKSADEIAAIRTAQSIACAAFEHMTAFARPGVQELELAIELGTFAARHGCQRRAFSMILTSGAKTALPHGAPPDRALTYGDVVMVDMSCMYEGFFSDMTRTFCVGKAGEKEQKIYHIVYEAQKAAMQAIKAEMPCNQIDEKARQIIRDAGYGAYFSHNLGHSIGSETHEQPCFSPQCTALLQAGQVLSVEPGIYLPNQFGIRIEDLALVTENGCEMLSKSPAEILVVS